MPTETVSIIMPTYNCARYISDSIESVLSQTHTKWELIIVDDASTDNTNEIVEKYLTDERIRFCRMEKQSGPAVARNKAIDLASGKYLAFIDSDDLWVPDKLRLQIEFMKKNGAKLSCTAYSEIDEDGNSIKAVNKPPKKAGYWKVFLMGNTVGNSTAMYIRNAFPDARVPDIRKRNDFALWLELTRDGEKFWGMPQILAKYRVRKSSLSSNKLNLIKYQWQLYRKIEKRSKFVAIVAFVTLAISKSIKKINHMIYRAFR